MKIGAPGRALERKQVWINAVQERNGRTRGGRRGLGTDMDRDVSLTLWMRGTGPVGKASGRREVGTGWCLGL